MRRNGVRNTKHREIASLERRERIARMYVEGQSQLAIAKAEGIAQPSVSASLKQIRAQWQASALASYDERKASELAKIDHLEVLAIEAWRRSCEDAETEVSKLKKALRKVKQLDECGPGRKKVLPAEAELELVPIEKERTRTRKGQSGNSAFLEVIRGCIELRCKICGLFQDVNVTNNQLNVFTWEKVIGARAPADDPIEARLAEAEGRALPAPEKR